MAFDVSRLIENLSLDDPHEYFMTLAALSAERSKDPCTQVGACIADRSGRVRGVGYNGMPRGCPDDKFPWGKPSAGQCDDPLLNKHLYVCHAELNAIVNAPGSLRDCVIYVTLFPCNECAKLIIQKGITEVVYLSNKHRKKISTKAAKIMFDSAKVKYWKYRSHKQIIVHTPAANLAKSVDCAGPSSAEDEATVSSEDDDNDDAKAAFDTAKEDSQTA